MKKYRYLITANCESDNITIVDITLPFNIIGYDGAFLVSLKQVMPAIDWKFDDGFDKKDTSYCQYVCYTEKNDHSHYLLASYTEE